MPTKHNEFKLITVHSRTAIYYVAGFFCFLVCILFVLRAFLLYGIEQLENIEIKRSSEQANAIVQRIVQTQTLYAYDWAYWDDTYSLMTVGDHGYMKKNITPQIFDILNLDMMLFVDSQNRLKFNAGRYDHQQNTVLGQRILADLAVSRFLLRFKGHPVTSNTTLSGLVLAEGNIYIVSILPIRDGRQLQPSAGWMLFVRNLVSRFPDNYTPILSADTTIEVLGNKPVKSGVGEIHKTEKTMTYRSLLTDMNHEAIGFLITSEPRAYYQKGNQALVRLATVIVIIGCVISLVMLVVFRFRIGNKIARFEEGLQTLLGKHIELDRRDGDEFDRIIAWVTKLAESTNQTQEYLNDVLQKFDVLYQSQSLGMLLVVDDIVVDVNKALLSMLGFSRNAVIGQNIEQLCVSDRQGQCTAQMLRSNLAAGVQSFEAKIRHASEQSIDCLVEATLINQNNKEAIIMSVRDLSYQRRQDHLIESLMTRDITTGFLNRPAIRASVEESINSGNNAFYMLYLSIDRLKEIADIYGEQTYSQLIGGIMKPVKRLFPGIRCGRVSESEFIVFVPGEHEASQVLIQGAKSLRSEFATAMALDDIEIKIDVNIVLLSSELGLRSFDAYIQTAAYCVTENKANSLQTVFSVDDALAKRAQLLINISRDFVSAIKNEQFIPYYQPIISTDDEKVTSYEALARWPHPVYGILSPDIFIPLAEKRKLIIELGNQVLEHACQFIRDVNRIRGERGLPFISVHVNIASPHFHYAGLAEFLLSVIQRYGIPPEFLVLELTESILLEAESETIEQMNRIRELGIKLALDDFGTGYSSFSTLTSFPIDIVKLDRSYVSQLEENQRARVLVQGIIDIAQQLGIAIVAEGVETQAQYAMLKRWHTTEIQGYYFSRPLTPSVAYELAIENG